MFGAGAPVATCFNCGQNGHQSKLCRAPCGKCGDPSHRAGWHFQNGCGGSGGTAVQQQQPGRGGPGPSDWPAPSAADWRGGTGVGGGGMRPMDPYGGGGGGGGGPALWGAPQHGWGGPGTGGTGVGAGGGMWGGPTGALWGAPRPGMGAGGHMGMMGQQHAPQQHAPQQHAPRQHAPASMGMGPMRMAGGGFEPGTQQHSMAAPPQQQLIRQGPPGGSDPRLWCGSAPGEQGGPSLPMGQAQRQGAQQGQQSGLQTLSPFYQHNAPPSPQHVHAHTNGGSCSVPVGNGHCEGGGGDGSGYAGKATTASWQPPQGTAAAPTNATPTNAPPASSCVVLLYDDLLQDACLKRMVAVLPASALHALGGGGGGGSGGGGGDGQGGGWDAGARADTEGADSRDLGRTTHVYVYNVHVRKLLGKFVATGAAYVTGGASHTGNNGPSHTGNGSASGYGADEWLPTMGVAALPPVSL
ncbi:hypothetical protein T492DRAFT_837690 [Pavlovales sp. CCMP2436]|nr:hypothetical protein T492DRAFT_837690 [Pavlovales sp. CCMP2436]